MLLILQSFVVFFSISSRLAVYHPAFDFEIISNLPLERKRAHEHIQIQRNTRAPCSRAHWTFWPNVWNANFFVSLAFCHYQKWAANTHSIQFACFPNLKMRIWMHLQLVLVRSQLWNATHTHTQWESEFAFNFSCMSSNIMRCFAKHFF